MTVWVNAVLPGTTETFSCWTMFPAAWSHWAGAATSSARVRYQRSTSGTPRFFSQ